MNRSLALLLVAGCVTLQGWGWGQAAPAQGSPEQAPAAGQKSSDANRPPERAAAPQSASGGFPLDQFQEFSAIMTGGILPGSDWESHIYRSRNLMRVEGRDAGHNYFVMDLEKQKSHGLAASGCLKIGYLNSRAFPFFLFGPDKKYERTPVGEETVDGHPCHVEDVTISSSELQTTIHLRLWEAEDLQGFPVKIENRPNRAPPRSMEYKNVVLGPQDPTLFIVPNQCQSSANMEPLTKAPPAAAPKKAPATQSQ